MGFASKNKVSFERLGECITPIPTTTWTPISHTEVVLNMRHEIERRGYRAVQEQIGLSKNDHQLFVHQTIDMGHEHYGAEFAARSSTDKTLSMLFAPGGSVFICDNLMVASDGMILVRKHTKNFRRDFISKLREAGDHIEGNFAEQVRKMEALRRVPIDLDRGYEILGRALGRGVLRPQQATVAFREWRASELPEHSLRNAYCLYQACTEALKRSSEVDMTARYAVCDDFFLPFVPAAPVSVQVPVSVEPPMADDGDMIIIDQTINFMPRFSGLDLD